MIVVFDSNVWLSELGLRSTAAAAVRFFLNLGSLLEVIRRPISLDEDQLQAVFLNKFGESVDKILFHAGFSLADRQSLTYKLFATESPDKLFLEFSIAMSCSDARGDGRLSALLNLKGDGLYSPTTHEFSALRSFSEHLAYVNADGIPQDIRILNGYGSFVVSGHKEITHKIRYALPDNGFV